MIWLNGAITNPLAYVMCLQVDITLSARGYKCKPSADKASRWKETIQACLAVERLWPGEASKLAGRLAWAGSHLFNRLGRAMLRPLFDQKSRRDGHIAAELRRSLQWWDKVLELDLAELRQWGWPSSPPMHLFCDAAGSPAYLGAVLVVGKWCWYTHMAPPEAIVQRFRRRRDNQIMGLELLAISLGLSTFESALKGTMFTY